MKKHLDHIDEEIIKLLHANARMPLKEIAKKVYLSSPAVSARIERLEENGIITGYRAMINPVELGYHIKAFVNVGVAPERKQEFYDFIRPSKYVVECNNVTGDFTMLVEVMFKDTEELDEFVGELQKFGSTQTQIVFSTTVENRGIPKDQTTNNEI
ncbi:MAG: Lrp/AsnC family transcriptional regulator [Eubacterium sp.]|nr:Lrp/AsnC family transcriptional regulator [Eubacterium sp.]